jgi:hypothetical protein
VLYWRHTRPPEKQPRTGRKERRREKRESRDRDGEDRKSPVDLDDLLGEPDPRRSVFADEDSGSPRSG